MKYGITAAYWGDEVIEVFFNRFFNFFACVCGVIRTFVDACGAAAAGLKFQRGKAGKSFLRREGSVTCVGEARAQPLFEARFVQNLPLPCINPACVPLRRWRWQLRS